MAPPKIEFTREMISAIFRLRKAGKSVDFISNKIGVNKRTFRRWRERHNVTLTRIKH